MPDINDDIGHIENEALIQQCERDIRKEYERAAAEMTAKLEAFLAKFKEEDEKQKELLTAGLITLIEYKEWRKRKILLSKGISNMRDVLARDAVNADKIAMSIVKGYMPEAYAIGVNYGTYLIETGIGIDTSFTLYDRAAVERLWRENPKLLPDPTPGSKTEQLLRENKDMRWNQRHIQSEITQGIMQGESIEQVAQRMKNVTDMDNRAANRNAATMLTSAHNGGRIDVFERAEDMGIKTKKVWLATLDGHTRYSHRQLDGQVREVNKPFDSVFGKLMFPGDPNGYPGDIYNCRCTMITQHEGIEKDVTNIELREHRALKGQPYDVWKNSHGNDPVSRAARNYTDDKRMMREYQDLLGKKAPKNIRDFQQVKYYEPEKWEQLKADARKARRERRQ